MHLSIHIERTGGTSLLSVFEEIYDPQKILIYKAGKDKLIRLSDIPLSPASQSINKLKTFLDGTPVLHAIYRLYTRVVSRDTTIFEWIDPENIPSDADIIHGHFTLDRFDGLCNNSFTSVMMREPLERMVSQFLHWRRAGGTLGWRVEIPFDENMKFTEYALHDEFANFQTRALGGKPLDKFDLVGVTRGFNRFVAQLKGKKWGGNGNSSNLNSLTDKPKYGKLGINKKFIKKFKKYNAVDYKNYKLAKQLAGF